MTTIIMQETPTKIEVAFDDKVSGGGSQTSTNYSQKVFVNPSSDVIFGVAGLLRSAQVLAYADLPGMDEDDWDVDRYVTLELIPAIREVVNEYGGSSDEADIEYVSVLAVVRDRVYHISAGSWTRNLSGIYGIGSGAKYAIGALAAGASIGEAVEIAADFDPHTSDNVAVWEIDTE